MIFDLRAFASVRVNLGGLALLPDSCSLPVDYLLTYCIAFSLLFTILKRRLSRSSSCHTHLVSPCVSDFHFLIATFDSL